jgi:hypothetical protein
MWIGISLLAHKNDNFHLRQVKILTSHKSPALLLEAFNPAQNL